MARGIIHIYTGGGKGKTTASVGLAVRAKSRGLRVLYVQFMKEFMGGETELLEKLGIEVIRFDKVLSPYFHPDVDRAAVRNEALKALDSLKTRLEEFDLAVLDEFNCLLLENLITDEEALDFLRSKPERLELVLTGRGAPQRLTDFAEHVIEVQEIKRTTDIRCEAKKGIEY